MIYLSKLPINPYSRVAQRELANPYQLHRTLLKGFGSNRKAAAVLHRIEAHPRRGDVAILVQSQQMPDWSSVYERDRGHYLLGDLPIAKQVDANLHSGRVLRFRLCANPTIAKRRRDENGKRLNSNRVPLIREEKQKEWLLNQVLVSKMK